MGFPAIDGLPPTHPGEFLRDELEALGLSAAAFATSIGVSTKAVDEILDGQESISVLMAVRLSEAFGTTPQYWLNLQRMYEMKDALAAGNELKE